MSNKRLILAPCLVFLAVYLHAGCGGGGGHGRANQPPSVTIARPRDGETCIHGESITFRGTAIDPEDGTLVGDSLLWTATPGGTIGTGGSFTRDDFSIGTYTITLTATDSKASSTSDSVSIRVIAGNQLPRVQIVEPEDGAIFYQGVPIVFRGTATDPEDGALVGGSLVWTSSPGGVIGTGETVTCDDLSVGRYIITLTATDSAGGSGSDSIAIQVGPPNQPPEVTISKPADGAVLFATCPVLLEGTAVDPEDGVLTGASLVWVLGAAWEIGTGESVILNNLPEGRYTISLYGTDSASASSSDSVTFEVRRNFVRILSIDNLAFPTVEVTLSVNTDAGQGCYLGEENFALTENWVSEVVESVVCAASGGLVTDIVVVFDDSGSMADNIEAMKAEATSFATEVLAAGLDARFGLITTVDSPEIDLPLTAEVSAFQDAVDKLTADGGTEPSLDGVMLGLQQMLWRTGALKVFLVITDEPTNGDSYTIQEVIDAVNAAGGTVFAVSEDYRTTGSVRVDKEDMMRPALTSPDEYDVRVLAEETGGIWLDINSADFSVLVDQIVLYLASLYTVVYTTSDPVVHGGLRCVEVTVTDPVEGVGGDCDVYTPPLAGMTAPASAAVSQSCFCR